MADSARHNIPELDGLRGVAILLVFMTHLVALSIARGAGGVDGVVRWVARFGWTGVDLFFVLSGFLITGILLDSKGQPHCWRNYAARRLLRIFPLYYGALILVLVVVPRVVHWNEPMYATLRANQWWYWTYLVNVLQVVKGGLATPLNTSHFWSLCIEEQFYLVWPLVVLSASRPTLLKVAAAACVFGLFFRFGLVRSTLAPWDAYVLTPGRLDGLMAGGALAVAAREGGLERLRVAAKPMLTASAALMVGLALWRGMEYEDPVIAVAGFPLLALVFGSLLVLAVTSEGALGRVLRTRQLRSWGKYSYGLYVIHYPLLGAVNYKFGGRLDGLTWGASHLPGVVVRILVVIPLSYGLAWCSYHLYEKRFLGLKRYFV